MQQLQEIDAIDDKIARMQASFSAKKAALIAARRDASTSTLNPNVNVNVQPSMVFNQYAQPFAPTSASTAS